MRFHRVPLKLGNTISDYDGTNTSHGMCRSTYLESCLRVFHIDIVLWPEHRSSFNNGSIRHV
jgi:hypothetical protein